MNAAYVAWVATTGAKAVNLSTSMDAKGFVKKNARVRGAASGKC